MISETEMLQKILTRISKPRLYNQNITNQGPTKSPPFLSSHDKAHSHASPYLPLPV